MGSFFQCATIMKLSINNYLKNYVLVGGSYNTRNNLMSSN